MTFQTFPGSVRTLFIPDSLTYLAVKQYVNYQQLSHTATETTWSSLTVNPTDKFLQRIDTFLNSRLSKRVVVLNAIEQLGETPETVGL